MAAIIAIAVAQTSANAAPKINTSYKSYSVPGKSAQQLFAHMSQYGPHANGAPALATTSANFSHTAKLSSGAKCRLRNYQVSMKFVITLPKARNRKAMSPTLKKRWGQFAAHAKWHEKQHRKIWIKCAHKIEAKVRKLKSQPNCDKAWAKARLVASKELARCDALHARFDKKEAGRAAKLPLIKQALRAPGTPTRASNAARRNSGKNRNSRMIGEANR